MTGEGFLSRWSRRKRAEPREAEGAAPIEPEAAAAPTQALEAPSEAPSALPPLTEEELAALPPVESIDEATDISGYLRTGVPAALKNAALRRFWSATPAVRDYLDPARDYAWDWNVPGGVPGDGPLGPGFDAKALAEKLFAKRETKVEDAARASAPGENANDAVSQSADAAASSADGEARGAVDHPDRDRCDAPESAAELDVAARTEAAPPASEVRAATENTPDLSDFRPRPRRHGGATPV